MGDNPERLNTEASFAALCGVSPIEYSSGWRSTRRSTTAAIGRPTPPCTASSSPACATTRAPRRTTNAAPRKARPDARRGRWSWEWTRTGMPMWPLGSPWWGK
ncbi:transposase [Streptomyces sp. NPDC002573]|uniref:transposase n=1 Tax=Streptomyces sp. NPDC002573 TaxID=3364651 RepID=UPI0036C96E43